MSPKATPTAAADPVLEAWEGFRRGERFPDPYDWVVLDAKRAGQLTCAPKLFSDGRYTLCASTQRR